MKLIVSIILASFASVSSGQNSYSVMYKYDDSYLPATINGEKMKVPVKRDKLVLNDSMSFWYRLPDGKSREKDKNIYGDKLIHHAILYTLKQNAWYSEVAFPTGAKEYLIRDSLRKKLWVFLQDSKSIAGFLCKPALSVDENNDSTLVWFTPDIPVPFGPFIYFGLPGLVLEVYDQVRHWHLIATEVKKKEFQIVMPARGAVISSEDFRKLRK